MKSKANQMKVALVTLGCPKNEVDSEVMAGVLSQHGAVLVEDAEDADAILINTCGFIEAAKRESIDVILTAVEMKKLDPRKRVAVWGCLSQRYQGEIEQEIPEVDAYFGVESFADMGTWLLGTRVDVSPDAGSDRLISTPSHTAYLKIADGCDHHCTFCAIPGIKGRYQSRPPDVLLREASSLADQGVKELILIAQDTSLYGSDLNEDVNLVSLLRMLVKIRGIEWIRIMYVHPAHVDDALIELIASEPKIVNYIDMPLQHIADGVLKRMGRGHDAARVQTLISRMRERIPELVLRTAFIVGFPGETEEDFDQLISFVESMQFHRLGAFVYSSEDGTAAADLPDAVASEIAQSRYDRLMNVQHEIALALNESEIGKVLPVLIDGFDPEEGLHYGRSLGDGLDVDQVIWVEGSPPVGEIVPVLIESSSAFELTGSWQVDE